MFLDACGLSFGLRNLKPWITTNMTQQPTTAAQPAPLTIATWDAAMLEVRPMVGRITSRYDVHVLNLACLTYTTQALLRHALGSSGKLDSLLELQSDCIRAWADENSVCMGAVGDALAGLERVGETADYLSKVPN